MNRIIPRPKTHWTQTKADKAKLKKSLAKAWRTRRHNAVMKTDEEFPDMEDPEIPKLPKTRRSKASEKFDPLSVKDLGRSGTKKSVGEDNTADSDDYLDDLMNRAEFQQAFPEVLADALGWDVIATDPKRKVIIISVQLE